MTEPLEARIAPASISLPYTDFDGDAVRVTVSVPGAKVPPLTALNLTFGPTSALGSQLAQLTLTDAAFEGASVTIAVTKAATGDGLAHLGRIDATGRNLGTVTVPGDLGEIDAGSDTEDRPAVWKLSARSMGLFGSVTGGTSDLRSSLVGGLGTLAVTTDVKDVLIDATGPNSFGVIGAVKIGGSLIGGAAADSGQIRASIAIATIDIGGNVIGGAGEHSGRLSADRGLGKVTIQGSVLGGAGAGSGQISSRLGDLVAVKIGGNLKGDTGAESGKIASGRTIRSLSIGGSILGGAGAYDTDASGDDATIGQVYAAGNINSLTVAHDIRGGAGAFSGSILIGGSLLRANIGGSLIGGDGGEHSGLIECGQSLGLTKIGGDVRGGAAENSGRVFASEGFRGITIGGSLLGGDGRSSGRLYADGSAAWSITIAHDLLGGSGVNSGRIDVGTDLSTLTIGGSILGGTANGTGVIFAESLGQAKIGRDLVGGSIGSGASTLNTTGYIQVTRNIKSIEIGGSILAGVDESTAGSLLRNASIRAGNIIGLLKVKGDIAGNSFGTDPARVYISALQQAFDDSPLRPAFGTISVGGRVEEASFLAGYDKDLNPRNCEVQIGSVTVGKDWIASNLVAGAQNLGTGLENFGDGNDIRINFNKNDPAITSKIASINIAGRVLGASLGSRSFGFVAEDIGVTKIAGQTVPGDFSGMRLNASTNIASHEIGRPIEFSPTKGPATLVDASTLSYTDIDGDRVTVKFSKPLLTAANVGSVFKFDKGTGVGGGDALRQLQLIDLAPLTVDGIGITMAVKRGLFGDGVADVGAIRASNQDVGAIVLTGDLGQIDLGGGGNLASLNVRSLGRLGLLTQAIDGTESRESLITGDLGSLTISTDLAGASITTARSLAEGSIGTVSIGGSMLGSKISTARSLNDPDAPAFLGPVSIRGNLATSTLEGLTLRGVTIAGSMVGGQITSAAGGKIASFLLGGNLLGGLGTESGKITAEGSLGPVTVGGSVIGGRGTGSASIATSTSGAGAVKIAHNVVGFGPSSAAITAPSFAGISVGGSLVGGASFSGTLSTAGMNGGSTGPIRIAQNVFGGHGQESGSLRAEIAPLLNIGGSVVGGLGESAGQILAGQLGSVTIAHDLAGGGARNTGVISGNTTTSLFVGGSVVGGSGDNSAMILAPDSVGSVKIGRDLLGGSIVGAASLDRSGGILGGRIGSVNVGGSIVAGSDSSSGSLTGNAAIKVAHSLGSLTITGSLIGNTSTRGTTAVVISAGGEEAPTPTRNLAVGKIAIGGLAQRVNLLAGFSPALVGVSADAQIGPVTVGGNWVASNLVAGAENTAGTPVTDDDNANFGNTNDRLIGNATTSIAQIASLTIRGNAAGSSAAGDHFGFSSRTIGALKIAGFSAPLTSGADSRIPLVILTGDVAVHGV